MRITERVTPVLAGLSAVATLACCLPVGGLAMLGLGGALGWAAQYQEWLLPASGLLLLAGGFQTWRTRRLCQKTSALSLAILGLSTLVVLLVLLFPQTVAAFFTDYFA